MKKDIEEFLTHLANVIKRNLLRKRLIDYGYSDRSARNIVSLYMEESK